MFTQAQQLFQKIPQDDDSIHARMRSDASKLIRVNQRFEILQLQTSSFLDLCNEQHDSTEN